MKSEFHVYEILLLAGFGCRLLWAQEPSCQQKRLALRKAVRHLTAATALLIVLFTARPSPAGTDLYPVTASEEAFFEQVRKAVLADDIERLSEVVSFPIVLRSGEQEVKIKDKRDFKEHAALILTTRLKSVVQNQSSGSLFKNWRGVMIGNGEIWFSEVGVKNGKADGLSWVYRIIAVNLNK